MVGPFDNFHDTRAAQSVSLAIDFLVNALVHGDIMEQRDLAEVRVLPTIHLLACIQELNHRHKSPLRSWNQVYIRKLAAVCNGFGSASRLRQDTGRSRRIR